MKSRESDRCGGVRERDEHEHQATLAPVAGSGGQARLACDARAGRCRTWRSRRGTPRRRILAVEERI
ncbi:hypothetical protein [Aromatoleum buckelii]|uniref:hypothetical protein n=1 Tax=Aromatoleum buckelii TaxID=200254 RepID=UPI001FF247F2|nr:hypothetical protein [Aromatoleum buckelii]MCK0511762.1 hypothetical protein [Aromatoleum buckelii]